MKTDLRINWLIAIVLAGWLVYLLAPILTPFVAAALLAYVGDPLADRLQKLKLPHSSQLPPRGNEFRQKCAQAQLTGCCYSVTMTRSFLHQAYWTGHVRTSPGLKSSASIPPGTFSMGGCRRWPMQCRRFLLPDGRDEAGLGSNRLKCLRH